VAFDRDKLRVAGWIAAAAVAVVLVLRALGGGGGDEGSAAVSVDGPAVPPPPGAAPSTPAGAPVLVHVAGEVRRPGVYSVPRGGRVHDAVQLAGGLTSRAEQAGVNLVARVSDGQQVVVPRRGAAGAAPAGAGPAGGGASLGAAAPGTAPGAKVSLASATIEELDAIDGIGPTLAKRIVEYRDQHGGFRSVDELRQVDGIGAKRFESLREAVTP
jgi:competence protein ComEA